MWKRPYPCVYKIVVARELTAAKDEILRQIYLYNKPIKVSFGGYRWLFSSEYQIDTVIAQFS